MALTNLEIARNLRFVEVVELLKKQKKIHSYKELLNALGEHDQYFTRYRKNQQAVSFDSLVALSKMFDINIEWLTSGVGEMFLNVTNNILEESKIKYFNKMPFNVNTPIGEFSRLLEKFVENYERDKEELRKDKEHLRKSEEHLRKNEASLFDLIAFLKKQIEGK